MSNEKPIVFYKSNFCSHSFAVEKFFNQHDIEAEFRNINELPEYKEEVMALNNGYASVPTLIFPDGTQLTEPSFKALRQQLGMPEEGLFAKIKKAILGIK